VQGALELLGIPYTGGRDGLGIAMDKVMTKRIWLAEGLPTPRYVWLSPSTEPRACAGARRAGPAADRQAPREGSSIGVTKVRGYSQMQDAVSWRPATTPTCCARVHRRRRSDLPGAGHGRAPGAAGDPHRRARATTTTRTSTSPTTRSTSARAACRPRKRRDPAHRAGLTAPWAAAAGAVPT
jgi:hypothetical protein